MIIKANSKEISVARVVGDKLREGGAVYPALRFEFGGGVSDEDIKALVSGNIEIIDDDGNAVGAQAGYNKLGNVSVIVGKVSANDERIAELEAELEALRAEKAELQGAVDVIVGGNAK